MLQWVWIASTSSWWSSWNAPSKSCKRPISQFGEAVWHLPRESPNTDDHKVSDEMRYGIWLGANERTEENRIDIEHGVVKCGTIKRRPAEHQWCGNMIDDMKGPAMLPVPGLKTDRVPMGIVDKQ